MPAPVKPWRILVKAILLFFILNFAFIYLYPWFSTHQIYNHIVPGRLRFSDSQPGFEQTAHALSLYDDMDAMFALHIISAKSKPSNEFRVIFFGDSSFWGDVVSASETLPGQINSLNLRNCRDQNIVAYNLAFPTSYVMKDFLILNKALRYNPDLIVWGITFQSLSYSNQNALGLLSSHSDETLYLIHHYMLNIPTDFLKPRTRWDQTLLANRSNIKKLVIIQEDALPWMVTGVDGPLATTWQSQDNNDIDPKNKYLLHSKTLNSNDLMFDVLRSADDLAHPVQILIVNEPIFIATGKNSQQYYNIMDSRILYDKYRSILSDWAYTNRQPYFDAWNSVPMSEFTNTPFHISANGEKKLASLLSPVILGLSCPR